MIAVCSHVQLQTGSSTQCLGHLVPVRLAGIMTVMVTRPGHNTTYGRKLWLTDRSSLRLWTA